ncbi:LLM class F420-dependent oxidoreductase [Saccharothrix lopnurensis]|uniref:LLM class F420-dependent oxidoreductase n=1 Tax=Saccharothrix lopnurensis TaxID=1670621 RepID=A0ABW1P570_9PSEU
MRLALNLRYLGPRTDHRDLPRLVREAERLGFGVAWVAEAFSSDAPSVLSWLAGQTTTIGLGSAAMQIPARSAAMTAMTAATLDVLSGGRFHLGLGVSGPQVAEGWHGARFGKPLARTREYVEIVRQVLAARGPVTHEGEHYPLPLPDGPGKPLRLGMRPPRPHLPIYLAAVGPRNLALAGEIADGWHAVFVDPEFLPAQLTGLGPVRDGFDVVANLPLVVADDVSLCVDRVRAYAVQYLGGMGSREENFYSRLAARMGYADAATEVQDHFLAGRMRAAAAAVPDEFIDRTSVLGPVDRVADRLRDYAAAGVTTLSTILFVRDADEGVRTLQDVATALDKAGVGA